MDLLQQFLEFIRVRNLFSPKDKLLLAVSGGVDSVVLSELCKQAGFNFSIAHCNFRLREMESERDKEFVKKLAEKYQVEFFVNEFDTIKFSSENKLSIQESARALRYKWLNDLLTPDSGLKFILTAHHAGDNIETVLMNFFKGTGIAGLRGIQPKQGKIIRPLLFAKKEELLSFANDQKLEWVEDSSNLSDKYSRNYIRNQVIPLITKIYPEAEANMAGNLQRFSDIEILYRQGIEFHKKKLLEKKENEIHIPILKLKKSRPLRTIIFEIISDYGFSPKQVDEVVALLDSDSGKFIQSATHRIINNRKWLIISPKESLFASNILIEEETNEVELENGKLIFENGLKAQGYEIPVSPSIASIDAGKIQFPLLLRKWKQGDYFYPLGMKNPPKEKVGKKKLARFFINEKLSKSEKENIWVLEMDKKIIWILNKRIDDRFKVTKNTSSILKITFLYSKKSLHLG